MKITIDQIGLKIIARDESGKILESVSRYCNPAALAQIILAAETLGEIDWESSRVARPEEAKDGRAALEQSFRDFAVKAQGISHGIFECALSIADELEWGEITEAEASSLLAELRLDLAEAESE